MIYIFRKKMQKWKYLLLIIIPSLLFGLGYWGRRMGSSRIKVASVNDSPIYMDEYQKSLREVQNIIRKYRELFQSYRIPVDYYLKMMGLDKPETAAMEKCVNKKILEELRNEFDIRISDDVFRSELSKIIPPQFIEASGKLNVNAYQHYLSLEGKTLIDVENEVEQQITRDTLQAIVDGTSYFPADEVKEIYYETIPRKSFKYLKIPMEKYVKEIEKSTIADSDLKKFFQQHKNNYKTKEKVKVKYWMLEPSEYEKNVTIANYEVDDFYNRNKGSMFRIPPSVKIKHIFLEVPALASPEAMEKMQKKAKDILEEVQKNPNEFGKLAQKYSMDKETASKGGVLGYFKRGTYDPELEKIAFRLKKKGEMEMVKTSKGFEIVMLEDRIPASFKPLKEVEKNILKTLKKKKALSALRRDLEGVIYQSKTEKDAYEKFAKTKGLKEFLTDWIMANDVEGKKIENLLAQKIFKGGRHKDQGYLVDSGIYFLYSIIEKEEAKVPPFEKIKDKVKNDYVQSKARKQLKSAAKNIKRQLLFEKKVMEPLAEKEGLLFKKTGMLKKGDTINDLKGLPDISSRIFVLSDKRQVFSFRDKTVGDYYIFQLEEMEKFDPKSFAEFATAKKKEELARNERSLIFNIFTKAVENKSRIEYFGKNKRQGNEEDVFIPTFDLEEI